MGKASIDIVVPQRTKAGSWMKGHVLLDIQGGSVRANTLKLTFLGREEAVVVYKETEQRNTNDGIKEVTVSRYETSRNQLIGINLPIAGGRGNGFDGKDNVNFIDNGGNIQPGQYQIPFEVEVPKYLPGSMEFNSPCGSYCSITYDLEAVLDGSGIFWNYKKKVPIHIDAKPMESLPPTPYLASPVNERVNFCCCINKGSISFGGKVDETRLSAGSRCSIHLSCRNYSTATTKRVEARVCQDVKWTASGRTKHCSNILEKMEFPSILSNIQVHAGDLSRNSMLVQSEMQDIFREINQGIHSGVFTIPLNVFDTYSGILIHVSHRIELEIKTGICISDPSVHIPIWIGQAASDASENYSPPPASNPGFLQAPVIVVPDSDIHPVQHIPSSNVLPVTSEEAEISIEPEVPSLNLLLKEMEATYSDLDLIERKIKNPDWATVWQTMTPAQFGKIVGRVQMGFDQPRVAKVLAEQIPLFRCEFVVSALQASKDYQRTALVEQLLPLCTDLEGNKSLIEGELTDWEKLVTESSFAHSLNQ